MMQGYQKHQGYASNFSQAWDYNDWNYSLFGYNDYADQSQVYWGQYDYNYNNQQNNWPIANNGESPYANNKAYDQPQPQKNSNMLKAKKSGRVFYPSKFHHSRHNSHDAKIKAVRENLSPLNRSHDSTCDSSSGRTDSSSKDGSGVKLAMAKNQSERMKEIVPIKLNFEDDVSPINPTLIVEVVSKNDKVKFELDPNDVKTVFEKFGTVTKVEILERCDKAVVTMEDPQNGQQAEKYLNFYQLPGTEAYLTVKWQFENPEGLQKANQLKNHLSKARSNYDNQTINNKNYQQQDAQKLEKEENWSLIASTVSSEIFQDPSSPKSPLGKSMSKECTSVSKFTAKFEIPIRNLPGFCIARKIIGHRGKNMKSILEKLKEKNFNGPIQDMTKLRLRGQGSGFKEGPNNCESPEPLHLCISSKYYEKYSEACTLVENLLKGVYQEYNNFCKWKGRRTVEYNVRKQENNPAWYLSNLFEAQQ